MKSASAARLLNLKIFASKREVLSMYEKLSYEMCIQYSISLERKILAAKRRMNCPAVVISSLS